MIILIIYDVIDTEESKYCIYIMYEVEISIILDKSVVIMDLSL